MTQSKTMSRLVLARCCVGAGLAVAVCEQPAARAQASATAKAPDVIVFSNGERLTGELVTADAKGVTFKSAAAGEIKIGWDKIRELQSSKQFAVVAKDEKLTKKDAAARVPQGPVSVEGSTVSVGPAGGTKTVPVPQIDRVVEEAAFQKAIAQPGFLSGWVGAVSAGASFIRATQDSTTFTGAVTLVRAIPAVDWLPARNRTLVDYSQAYGSTSQPLNPTIKTNIFHAGAERDESEQPAVPVWECRV